MANPYFIKIELPAELESGPTAGSLNSGTNEPSAEDVSATRVLNATKKLVSFAAVASTADKIISYNLSQVSLQTGANEYEQRMNAAYSLGRQVVGAGAALIGGAVMGGPAGFAVAAIGIVASGINQLIGYAQREQTLQTEKHLENFSIGMQNVRAGTASRRGSNQ